MVRSFSGTFLCCQFGLQDHFAVVSMQPCIQKPYKGSIKGLAEMIRKGIVLEFLSPDCMFACQVHAQQMLQPWTMCNNERTQNLSLYMLMRERAMQRSTE